MSEHNSKKKELTLEQRNLILAQIEFLKEARVKVIVERDKMEAELNKVTKIIEALKVATDE